MKRRTLIPCLLCTLLTAPCFAGAVHVTADLSADFMEGTSTQAILSTFTLGSQPLLWGFGWEVVLDRVGVGGNYDVSFFQDGNAGWWLDWLAPAVFMSYHPLRAIRWLDPFVEVGVGCAGRVNLSMGDGFETADAGENLLMSLFPFAAAGLSLDLDGLLISAKASYTPYNGQIPVTSIGTYPLGKFQVTLSGGLAITW